MATEAEIVSFIKDAGWGEAERASLGADFSTRRFWRLRRSGADPGTAILMSAAADQKTENYVQLAFLLRRLDLPAPEIYESDIVRGLVLMQDFGDALCGGLLDKGADSAPFDKASADILAHLHLSFTPSMLGALKSPLFNAALFTDQASLFLDHYFPHIFRRPPTAMERSGFAEAWHAVLAPLDALPRSLLLRDYMPDNAIALSAPVLGHSLGLLDFQDAGLGPIAYDIGSWCENCRREGGMERLPSFVEAYVERNPVLDSATLLLAARLLLAQRYTRVLGIFVRLEKFDGLARVWSALRSLLRDVDQLAPVQRWFMTCAPPR